jgi:hypothetical protein
MTKFYPKEILGMAALSLAISSCGGGGGGGGSSGPPVDTSGTAEGLWNGTTGTGRTIAGLVLDNGGYWFIYTAVGNNTVIAGAVQGNGASSFGKFTSTNGVDFNLEGLGINDFSFSGTYTAKSQIGGTLTYTGGSTNTLSGMYSTDYDLTPSLATVAGTYAGSAATAGGVEAATVTIASGGAITGSSASGCSFTGAATVHPKGNVYDITVTFNGGICSNRTGTVTGVAYYVASSKELVSAALNSTRSNGFLFIGVKP